jgi:hypothetical protein
MIFAMNPASEAQTGSRWFIGMTVMLFSLVVLAGNPAQIDISPVYDDDRLVDEIYSSSNGWRTPPAYEREWRPETRKQESRIQFGYNPAYQEMKARGSDYSPDAGPGLNDQPQNTQFKIGF